MGKKCHLIFPVINDLLELSKNLKDFLVYVKKVAQLIKLNINPVSSLKALNSILSIKKLESFESNDLGNSIYFITISLLKYPSLKEGILEYILPDI
ncbi:MAG: hypothetical protein C4539_01210, partial [Ignavibacteriales bacterium]